MFLGKGVKSLLLRNTEQVGGGAGIFSIFIPLLHLPHSIQLRFLLIGRRGFPRININKVIVAGTVGGDPREFTVENAPRRTDFSLATSTSRRYAHYLNFNLKLTHKKKRDAEGNWQNKTEWHNIVCYNDSASDYITKYIRKGYAMQPLVGFSHMLLCPPVVVTRSDPLQGARQLATAEDL